MLMPPQTFGFNYVTGNVITVRPGSAGFGTSITPAQNSFGSYTEILSDTSVTRDCYAILINVNSIFTATQAKDSLTTIGIDTAGGTSYVDLIPNLLTSCAGDYGAKGGIWYYFPVYIPAGSAIAAKGSVNNATVGTQRVAIWLYGAPTNPESLIYGHGVESVGITAASSCGTTVTSGTVSEGSWTSLGTTAKKWIACTCGMGINDGTMSSGNIHHADISYGDGTNQIMLDMDRGFTISTTSEDLNTRGGLYAPFCNVPAGSTIYGRLQVNGTADSGLSMAAYGVY